ncbi:hypothetical protein C8Q80DRAFT_1120041 [Daedaleopsis nitida]|nr:hypothetical protein C8Q80DRAFT_1120041 [Daedaleopsis nitida]
MEPGRSSFPCLLSASLSTRQLKCSPSSMVVFNDQPPLQPSDSVSAGGSRYIHAPKPDQQSSSLPTGFQRAPSSSLLPLAVESYSSLFHMSMEPASFTTRVDGPQQYEFSPENPSLAGHPDIVHDQGSENHLETDSSAAMEEYESEVLDQDAPYDESDWEDCEVEREEDTGGGAGNSHDSAMSDTTQGSHGEIESSASSGATTHASGPSPEDVDPYHVLPRWNIHGNPFSSIKNWHPVVLLTSLLVSWLHLSGHLSFRHCDTALTVIGYILMAAGQKDLVALLYGSLKGVENTMEAWRRRERIAGWFVDIFDGAICKQLKGPDGLSFFRYDLRDGGPDGELRLGLTLGVDWFSYLRSKIAPTHSLCPMSFNIINLPAQLRYRTAYLLLTGIMPGPKEADPDQVQCRSDLRQASGPQAWGFWFTLAHILLRSRLQQMLFGHMAEQDDFVKQHATRWSELCRLPYFDMCRMIVIDPMHNLFLGLVKTHFYHIWVQLKILRKSRELRVLHDTLDKLQLPAKLGRLPKLIATIIGPLIKGTRREERLKTLHDLMTARKAKRAARKAAATSTKRRRKNKGKKAVSLVSQGNENLEGPRCSSRVSRPTSKRQMVLESDDDGAVEVDTNDLYSDGSNDEDAPQSTPSQANLNPQDVTNFLKLSEALTLFLAEELSEEDILKADRLLREYCSELIESC